MKTIHLTKAFWINTFAIALSIPLVMPVQAQAKIGFGMTYGTAKTYSGFQPDAVHPQPRNEQPFTSTRCTSLNCKPLYHPTTYSTATTYSGTAYSTVKTYHPGINSTGTTYSTNNTGTNGIATTNSIDTINSTSKNYGVTTYGTSKTYSTRRNYGKTTYQGTIYSIGKTYKTLKINSINIKNSNGNNPISVKNATQRKNGTSKNYGGIVLSKDTIRASLIKDAKNYQKTNASSDADRFDWSWLNWGGLLSLSASAVALFSYRLLREHSKLKRRALTQRSGFRSYTFMLNFKLSPAYQNRLRGNRILLQRDQSFKKKQKIPVQM